SKVVRRCRPGESALAPFCASCETNHLAYPGWCPVATRSFRLQTQPAPAFQGRIARVRSRRPASYRHDFQSKDFSGGAFHLRVQTTWEKRDLAERTASAYSAHCG